MEINKAIEEYKKALRDYEIALETKDRAREKFLQAIENQPGQYEDILVSKVAGTSLIKWHELAKDIQLSADFIKRYTTYKDPSIRITVKRIIAI